MTPPLSFEEKIAIGVVYLLGTTTTTHFRMLFGYCKTAISFRVDSNDINLERLVTQGWLVHGHGQRSNVKYYACSKRVNLAFVKDLIKDCGFVQQCNYLFSILLENHTANYELRELSKNILSGIVVAYILQGNEAGIKNVMTKYEQSETKFYWHYYDAFKIPMAYELLEKASDYGEFFPRFSTSLQLAILDSRLVALISEGKPIPDCTQLNALDTLSEHHRQLLMTAAFAQADFATMEKLAAKGHGNTQVLLEAFQAMRNGEWKMADGRFTRYVNAEDILRKRELQDFANGVLIFALFAACGSQAPASRISSWCRGANYAPWGFHFNQLAEVIRERRKGGGNVSFSTPLDATIVALTDCHLAGFILREGQQSLFYETAKKLLDSHQNILACYLLGALSLLLPADSPQLPIVVEKLSSFDFMPFVSKVNHKDAWEKILDELEKKFVPKTPAATTDGKSQGRILWILKTIRHSGTIRKFRYLEAMYQAPLKRGGFSSPTSISFRSLFNGRYSSLLTEDEKNISPLIANYYYDDYFKPQILNCLCKSENVFLDDLTKPVRLEPEENILQTRLKSDGSIELSLKYFNDDEYEKDGYGLLDTSEPGACRFHVLMPSEAMLKFFQTRGEEGVLEIPKEGGERLAAVVSRLSATIQVAGALSGEAYRELPQVQGQCEMHALLERGRDVLHVEFRCCPLPGEELLLPPGRGAAQRTAVQSGQKVFLTRNLKQEHEVFRRLLKDCPTLPTTAMEEASCDLDGLEDILQGLSELHEAGFVLDWREGSPLTLLRQPNSRALTMSCRSVTDWFALSGELKVSDSMIIPLQQLLEAMDNRTGRFVRLSDDSYLQLTQDLIRKLDALRAASLQDKKSLKVSPAALPMLSSVWDDGLPDALQKAMERVKASFASDIAIPTTFQGTLRPYQEDGFRYLARLADCRIGCCLADDMGLGKTIQLLALLLREARHGVALVLCPASVCLNWKREAERFAPTLRAQVLPQQNREEFLRKAGSGDLIISSYGILQSESELFESIKWHLIILDEAQAIKNHLAKRSKSTKRLQADIRIAATGTPVENRLLELWSIFDFLNPGLLGSATSFEATYCQNGLPRPELKRLVSPLIMRRKKSDVLDDLPAKTEIQVDVILSEDEQALYEAMRRQAVSKLEADEESSRISILAELTRLRRFCCHPALAVKELPAPIQGAKLQRLLELVQDLRQTGNQALVFSQYVDFLQMIRKAFDDNGITYQYLDGACTQAQRAKAIDNFQNGVGEFFLISLKAGGMGLNLTAASYVILTDPWWNPAVEQQAADRVHRIGQTKPVTLYRLVTANTVEEKVIQLHAHKRQAAEDILSNTESNGITLQELLSLFK